MIASILGLLLSIYSLAVSSEPTEDGNLKERAQSHFSKGEALFESGQYLEAAGAFTLAYETLPHYSVLANIGLSYERAGAFPSAVTYFRKYLAALADEGEDNPRIKSLLQETLAKVAEMDISAECLREECRIYVDSVEQGVSPVHIIVLPGAHDIQLVSEGSIRVTKKMTVGPGETKTYLLSESAVAPPKETRPGLGRSFWIATASAAGFGIASGILWGTTLSTKKDFDNAESTDEKKPLQKKGEALNVAALVTTGIAGAAVLTATILAGVHLASSKPAGPDTEENAVSVNVSPGHVGIAVAF